MNVVWLKYAVEVAKCGSINKAAEKLYIGQPNLSRAIHDLEDSLGVSIFERTPKGMNVTVEGEEFLGFAKKILSQIDEVEMYYKDSKLEKQKFSVSVPRASYIGQAFADFEKGIDKTKPCELFYKETNASRAIKNILESDYKLGIIRYADKNKMYFEKMLEEKGLVGEVIVEFTYNLIMSKNSPLAGIDNISFDDLEGHTEIAHADPFVPSLTLSAIKKEELPDNISKRIFVFERASQFEILSNDTDTFMWVSSLPKEVCERYDLVCKKCSENTKVYRDVLIYKKDYKLSKLDKAFIDSLIASKRKTFK